MVDINKIELILENEYKNIKFVQNVRIFNSKYVFFVWNMLKFMLKRYINMIYFISDTHFCHNNIIKYCNRNFKDTNEMNETIISNWNNIISKDDIVYHLGDFCLSNDIEIQNIFNRLNGNKILIRGNHDRKSVKFYENMGFKVLTHAPIILDEYKLMLSHIPLPDTKIKSGYINLHGHIHNKKINEDYPKNYSDSKHINLSVDVTNYKPISLNEINEMRSKNNENKR